LSIDSSNYFGDPSKVSGFMIPMRRNNVTSVRVRTKNNSFVYGESNIDGLGSNLDGMQKTKL
jgi:hypothetical protein